MLTDEAREALEAKAERIMDTLQEVISFDPSMNYIEVLEEVTLRLMQMHDDDLQVVLEGLRTLKGNFQSGRRIR